MTYRKYLYRKLEGIRMYRDKISKAKGSQLRSITYSLSALAEDVILEFYGIHQEDLDKEIVQGNGRIPL